MAESSIDILTRLTGPATAIVRARFGHDVTLVQPQLIKDVTRTIVARYRMTGALSSPASVIVKFIRDDPATGFSDWASLAFLSTFLNTQGLAPSFLGGDVDQRVFVLADLGSGHTLHDELMSGTPATAVRVLRRLAQQMARLHVATIAAEPDFLRLRQALPASQTLGRRHEAAAWFAAQDRVEAWFARAGCDLPAGFDACLAQIATLYAEPETWLCFTHGDPAPSNNHIGDAAVWLLDFEYGAFRHALYDMTAWHILCPLPLPVLELMRQTFQETLAEGFPQAHSRVSFDQAWGFLCAYRALALLTWIDRAVLECDRPVVDDWTARQAVLAAIMRALDATAGIPQLAPLSTALDRLQGALRARWSEFAGRTDIATRWPALTGAG